MGNYTRLNLKNGSILDEKHLEHIESGIIYNEQEISTLSDTVNRLKDNPPTSGSGGNETVVEAGTYGGYDSETGVYNIPNVSVDEKGRVTNISESVLPKVSEVSDGYIGAGDYKKLSSIPHYGCVYGKIPSGSTQMNNYFYIYDTSGVELVPVIDVVGVYTDGSNHIIPLDWKINYVLSSKGITYYIYVYLKEPLEFDVSVKISSNYPLSLYYSM